MCVKLPPEVAKDKKVIKVSYGSSGDALVVHAGPLPLVTLMPLFDKVLSVRPSVRSPPARLPAHQSIHSSMHKFIHPCRQVRPDDCSWTVDKAASELIVTMEKVNERQWAAITLN